MAGSDAITVLYGDKGAVAQEIIDARRAELGLDQPPLTQFIRYVAGAVRGDFGTSYTLGRPVSSLIGAAFGNTLKLAIMAALFAWIVGIVCGVIAAVKKNGIPDRIFMGLSLFGVSMPVFMVAMILQYVFAFYLHWLPISGGDNWKCYILPAIALGWNSAGSVSRLVRSTLIEILGEDYIDTARAKGRGRMGVIVLHALRNAMLPVVTMMAIQLSSLLSGAVITETIFSINGVGRLMVDAIKQRDFPVVQGGVLFISLAFCLINLLIDIAYSFLDPKIKSQYK